MAILFISKSDNPSEWLTALRERSPDVDFRVWPNVGEKHQITTALVWKAPPGALTNLPNLSLIQSLGAGIDHIYTDPHLPLGVPVARLVDKELTRQMVEYSVLAVLNRHRRMDELRKAAHEHKWHVIQPIGFAQSRVGVLGLGEIGMSIAKTVSNLGFIVQGWSRTPKKIEHIKCHHGLDGLKTLLPATDILICALPLTKATNRLLDKRTLSLLPRSSYLINLARGEHVVENDLLDLINGDHIAGACLDVFEKEPLPTDHPFWNHPNITVTPHLAGLTIAASAADQVLENIRLVQTGAPPQHQVDRQQGY